MKILKVFNNNSVAAINENMKDVIITGAGVGFQKKIGELVDDSRIERTYILKNMEQSRFIDSIVELPRIYFEITEMIICKATKELNADFDGSVFISISDHISFAIKRKKAGIYLPNIVLNETKIIYSKEYMIGFWALDCIEERLGVRLNEDEAGYIALHLVNFSLTNQSNNATKIVALTKEVLEIINIVMKVELHQDSLAYARICIHIKYMAEKILNKRQGEFQDTTANIRDILKEDLRLNLCINRITKLIFERYDYYLSPDEQTYLCIHIKKNMNF